MFPVLSAVLKYKLGSVWTEQLVVCLFSVWKTLIHGHLKIKVVLQRTSRKKQHVLFESGNKHGLSTLSKSHGWLAKWNYFCSPYLQVMVQIYEGVFSFLLSNCWEADSCLQIKCFIPASHLQTYTLSQMCLTRVGILRISVQSETTVSFYRKNFQHP